MKLWLQVLFAQGYLWRERFPYDFVESEPEPTRINWLGVFVGAAVVGLGVAAISQGSLVYGLALVATGTVLALSQGDSLGLKRLFGSRAFWTSVSWASATLTLVGMSLVVVLSAILGTWPIFIISALFLSFFGTWSLRAIELRYLYFADRNSAWDTNPAEGDFREWYVATYWRLPREILKSMFRRAKEMP